MTSPQELTRALEIGLTTKYHKLPLECGQLGIWEVILENEKNYIEMLKMLVEEIKNYFNNRHSPPQRPDTNVGM
jgi:hypothetical protein